MKTIFSNATVMWDESDIIEREALVSQCVSIVKRSWSQLNRAIQFRRVETPILTPSAFLGGHIAAGFPLLETSRGVLRPETTAGCIAAFNEIFPIQKQRQSQLPYCVWQFGKSFRNEDNPETMRASKLRLIEFHQLEFELFASISTKADYIESALSSLCSRFGGKSVISDELPHYSRKTIDWEKDGLEVAGCSERIDWPEGIIYEISIGIDRLLTKVVKPNE